MSEINWSKNNYSNRIGLKCHTEMEEMVGHTGSRKEERGISRIRRTENES